MGRSRSCCGVHPDIPPDFLAALRQSFRKPMAESFGNSQVWPAAGIQSRKGSMAGASTVASGFQSLLQVVAAALARSVADAGPWRKGLGSCATQRIIRVRLSISLYRQLSKRCRWHSAEAAECNSSMSKTLSCWLKSEVASSGKRLLRRCLSLKMRALMCGSGSRSHLWSRPRIRQKMRSTGDSKV